MTLFVRIVDGEVESIGPLPAIARRLDTGQKVEPSEWLVATGYWRLEGFDVTQVPDLTTEQQTAIAAEVAQAVEDLDARRLLLEDAKRAWEFAKSKSSDYNDIPWSPPSTDPPPTGNASLALHGQQITYLFNRTQELNRWLMGDGTTNGPGIGDVVFRLALAVRDLWDQATEVPDES
jgi:hypothetical protein